MKKRTKKRILTIFPLLLICIVFLYFQNNSIVITEINISSAKIPQGFDQYKIVHLSDLHSKSFGHEQSKLVHKINKVKPDLIVFTGDLIDAKRYDEETSLTLMEKLVHIAPVYYVTGNHEWWSGKFDSLNGRLKAAGVQVMSNTSVALSNGHDKLQLVGIDDPAKVSVSTVVTTEEGILQASEGMTVGEHFTILLAHRPELFPLYAHYEFDLVFSGHAHGGQFRIPFVGGLVAPDQGFFPKYTFGKYIEDKTTMIVSRGLGNSIIPIRIFNRPEIIVVTLKSEQD